MRDRCRAAEDSPGAIASSSRMPIHASATPATAPRAVSSERLGQHLPDDAPAAGAERGAHRQLRLAQRRADQQQVRDVRAGDEEQEDHRAHQRQNRRAGPLRPASCASARAARRSPSPCDNGKVVANLRRDRFDLFLRPRQRRARLQPADRPQAERVAVRVVVAEAIRHPEVRPLLDVGAGRKQQLESRREHADDLRPRAARKALADAPWDRRRSAAASTRG